MPESPNNFSTCGLSLGRLLQLPSSKRPPCIRRPVNPFGFCKVFQRRTLGSLVAATWLTATTEAKNTTDVFQQVVKYIALKYIAPAMIRALGPRRFTTVSLAAQALACGLWGCASGSLGTLVGGLALLLPSINATSSKCKPGSRLAHEQRVHACCVNQVVNARRKCPACGGDRACSL